MVFDFWPRQDKARHRHGPYRGAARTRRGTMLDGGMAKLVDGVLA